MLLTREDFYTAFEEAISGCDTDEKLELYRELLETGSVVILIDNVNGVIFSSPQDSFRITRQTLTLYEDSDDENE